MIEIASFDATLSDAQTPASDGKYMKHRIHERDRLGDGGCTCVCSHTSPGPSKKHMRPSPLASERTHGDQPDDELSGSPPSASPAAQPIFIGMSDDQATT